MTSIFSAGNTYTYCATRTLYGLALEGRAPKVLRRCTKGGVPYLCFIIVMIFPFLSFLSVSSGSAVVLTWLINLITAGGVSKYQPTSCGTLNTLLTFLFVNYIVMSVTYIFFYRAVKAQGIDRQSLPYTGYFQPYCGYLGAGWMIAIVLCYGYSAFMPWSVDSFISYYAMVRANMNTKVDLFRDILLTVHPIFSRLSLTQSYSSAGS